MYVTIVLDVYEQFIAGSSIQALSIQAEFRLVNDQ